MLCSDLSTKWRLDPGRRIERGRVGWLRGVSGPAVLAGALAAGLLVLADTAAYARLGVPVPSLTAQAWVAGLRTVAELTGGLAVGSLVFAAFVVAPQRSGVLDVDGWLAVRRAGVAAGVAGVVAVLLGPLMAADLSGVALGDVLGAIRRIKRSMRVAQGVWNQARSPVSLLAKELPLGPVGQPPAE